MFFNCIGIGATPIESIPKDKSYNIVIIDGTWSQARSIYHNSELLQNLRKVELKSDSPSNYVIRTQPTEVSLSTVETAAVALSFLEEEASIYNSLTAPLKALCQFQLQYGAVSHHRLVPTDFVFFIFIEFGYKF